VYVDWARGIAVLLMIQAHTTDAWTRASAKSTNLFRDVNVLSGFAAPLFLWLAGLALVLSAERIVRREGSRSVAVETVCRRGLEIFILAFLFRLQAFTLSPGSHPVALFRVDILNIMGPAIVVAGILWGMSTRTWATVASYAAAATLIAMATPIVRASATVDFLPTWVQWYLRPAGEYTTFTVFPWVGFVFAGGACGALMSVANDKDAERRVQIGVAVCGAALVALGAYTSMRPSLYRVSSFWTSSPTWFAIRVGILMLALAFFYALAVVGARFKVASGTDPLAHLGRSSLFVYWIHVELVYGYTTWLLRGRLPLWGTAIAFVVFSVLMYCSVLLRDWIVDTWRNRRRLGPAAETATA
jgi:uncharacterized membrane protein